MNATIKVPVEWLETIGRLCLAAKSDARLQQLIDGDETGMLIADERVELAALIELSERLSLVRTEASLLLGRRSP